MHDEQPPINENQAIGSVESVPDGSKNDCAGDRILYRLQVLRGKLADIQRACVGANERARKIKRFDLEAVEKADPQPRDAADLISRLDAEIDALFVAAEEVFDICNETDNLLALVVG